MSGLAAVRAWIAGLWHRLSAPAERSGDGLEWDEQHWQVVP